ncbi:hypothetical protein GCM10018954_081140 [Kutzneria kofuensis]
MPTDMVSYWARTASASPTPGSRPAAHFLVDAEAIAVGVLTALSRRGEIDHDKVVEATRRYRLDDPQAAGPQTTDSGAA